MNLLSDYRASNFSKYSWLCDDTLARWLVNHLKCYGNSIIDIGCGDGFMFKYYNKAFSNIAAIEPSKSLEPMACKCASEYHVRFMNAAAEKIPFADHSYDVAFSKSSLHHFENRSHGLMEMKRVGKNVVAVMEVVAPSIQCLPFLHQLLTTKESGRTATSVFTLESLNNLVETSIQPRILHSLFFDQYIDIETWIEYSDLSIAEKQNLYRLFLSMNTVTKQFMQVHIRNEHHVMLRRMCLCIAFI